MCSHSKSGSFIKPKTKYGKSFITAVIERYGDQGDDMVGVNEGEMFVLGHHQKTTVEIVGAKSVNKQQRLVSSFFYLNFIKN